MKYIALIISSIAAAFLVVAMVGVTAHMGEQRRRLPPLQMAVAEPTEAQFKAQADLKNALQALMTAEDVGATFPMHQNPSDLFAITPAQSPEQPNGRASTPPRLPVVNVILAVGSEGKAIVDGRLVRAGDRLKNGLLVRSIRIDSVTFINRQGKRIRVTVPLARLRILGAYPPTHVFTGDKP